MRVTLILSVLFFFMTDLFGTETSVFKGSVKTREELGELYAIPDAVFRCLLHEERELQAWSKELEEKTPQTPKDVWTTFAVCNRSGNDDVVCKMLVLMCDMPLEEIVRPDQYADVVYRNIRLTRQTPIKWNPLKVFYETFGAVYAPDYPSNIKPVIDGMRNEKWSQEQINQWLKERFEQALNKQSKNPKIILFENHIQLLYPISPAAQRWLSYYFAQLHQANRAEQIVAQFANEAREHRNDLAKLTVFLLSLEFCNEISLDINWISNNIDQYTTLQTWIIGQSIVNVNDSIKLCETFLKHALDKVLDKEDCKNFQAILQMRTSMKLPVHEDELVQAIFRVEVMDGLNKMYLDQKRNDEAQKIMIAARDIRKKYNLPEGSFLAGRTQMSSGQQIVETEIKNREVIDNTKPAYWMERAAYYQGREEPQEQEKAIRKALSLYDTPEFLEKNSIFELRHVRGKLYNFLQTMNCRAEMAELFFQQHEIVKNEPHQLWALYNDIREAAVTEQKDEFDRVLAEDLRKAVEQYQTAPESEKQKIHSDLRSGLDLIRYSPEIAVSMGIFDFKNNPDAWDILKFQNILVKNKILQLLLFQKDNNGKTFVNENILEFFYIALEEKKLPVEFYYTIGEVIRMEVWQQKNFDGYKVAIKFFEGALRHFDQFPDNHPKYSIHSQLASCSLELGDWRNGEKYTVESYENHGLQEREVISWLYRAARIADKAGEKKEAERIRWRIANVGL